MSTRVVVLFIVVYTLIVGVSCEYGIVVVHVKMTVCGIGKADADMGTIDNLSVLANVVAAARFELQDRDADEIPNKLSGAASSTGKRVPPPHQRAILSHIEADKSFRLAVHERFIDAAFDDPLGLAYLEDPTAARPSVDLEVAVRKHEALEAEIGAERARTAKIEASLAESRTRLDRAKQAADEELTARADADKRARSGLERAARDAEESAVQATTLADAIREELVVKDAVIAELEGRVTKLNEKLAKRKATPPLRSGATASTVGSDPVEIARDLDAQERRLRTYREAHVDDNSLDRRHPALAVPKGISSSDSTAIDAVIAQMPERMIIDGYNVAGLVSSGSFASRAARDDVINRAAKLVRDTNASVIVVFDAKHSTEGSTSYTSRTGVKVMFEGETIADDTIVGLAHGDADRCVVITNDREIHDRVRRSNCVSIFSTAFVSWTEHLNRS